jgi:ABC-type lipoprotein release transport system permease subunit
MMLLAESTRLAAILKSLGYNDRENTNSFLAIYIPVILIGLAIAIPFSLLLTTTFQFAIFKGIGILIKPTIE